MVMPLILNQNSDYDIPSCLESEEQSAINEFEKLDVVEDDDEIVGCSINI